MTVAVAGPYVDPQARHRRERGREDYGGEFGSARNGAMSTSTWENEVEVMNMERYCKEHADLRPHLSAHSLYDICTLRQQNGVY